MRQRGIAIPADTWFVGALHDTANDSVEYYDLDALPATHAARFDDVRATALDRARRESAHERCRRFDDAPLALTPDQALAHVEGRSTHLAQPRPEYGHCTNAVCIVGRRAVTRGLHLDRRPFLVSYDPATDVDDAVLERILRGRRTGRRGHQPGVLLLVGRQRGLRLRHEAAAQRHRSASA